MKKDRLTIRAKREGYRARSAFKLIEINKKFGIIKNGNSVLDLGCAPGGWLIIAKKSVGDKGYVLGVDKETINPIEGVDFLLADVFLDTIFDKINRKFDVVISDLAPKTTGIKELDVGRSLDLVKRVLVICSRLLKQNGHLICKVFQGVGSNEAINVIKKYFRFFKISKPQSSKKRSRETYLICKGFKSIQVL